MNLCQSDVSKLKYSDHQKICMQLRTEKSTKCNRKKEELLNIAQTLCSFHNLPPAPLPPRRQPSPPPKRVKTEPIKKPRNKPPPASGPTSAPPPAPGPTSPPPAPGPTSALKPLYILGPEKIDVINTDIGKIINIYDKHTNIPKNYPYKYDVNTLQFLRALNMCYEEDLEVFLEDPMYSGVTGEDLKHYKDLHEKWVSSAGDLSTHFFENVDLDTLNMMRVYLSGCVDHKSKDVDELCRLNGSKVHTIDVRQSISGKIWGFNPLFFKYATVSAYDATKNYEFVTLENYKVKINAAFKDIEKDKLSKNNHNIIIEKIIKCLIKLKSNKTFYYNVFAFFKTEFAKFAEKYDDLKKNYQRVQVTKEELKEKLQYAEELVERVVNSFGIEAFFPSQPQRKPYDVVGFLNFSLVALLFDIYTLCRMCRYAGKDKVMVVFSGSKHSKRISNFWNQYAISKATAEPCAKKMVVFEAKDLPILYERVGRGGHDGGDVEYDDDKLMQYIKNYTNKINLKLKFFPDRPYPPQTYSPIS